MHDTAERREPRFVYLGDALPGSDPTGRFAWRLDAANHRPLGRAVRVCTTLDACVAAARAAVSTVRATDPVIVSDPQLGVWRWRVDRDGSTVALSPHGFARRVECQRAFTQFRAALDHARPEDGVVRLYGPRALRAFTVESVNDAAVC